VGDAPPESARNIVQAYVPSSQKTLGWDVIAWRPGGYALDEAVCVDAVEFEHGPPADDRAATDPATVADALSQALELCRGEPLADVAAPFAEEQRTRLTELRLSCSVGRCQAGLRKAG
jgi:DNA-binding SARP family transcriptional activator